MDLEDLRCHGSMECGGGCSGELLRGIPGLLTEQPPTARLDLSRRLFYKIKQTKKRLREDRGVVPQL